MTVAEISWHAHAVFQQWHNDALMQIALCTLALAFILCALFISAVISIARTVVSSTLHFNLSFHCVRSLGFCLPFILRGRHKTILFFSRTFAAGVVLATALVHIIPGASAHCTAPARRIPSA